MPRARWIALIKIKVPRLLHGGEPGRHFEKCGATFR
jgi:hypothetical protein